MRQRRRKGDTGDDSLMQEESGVISRPHYSASQHAIRITWHNAENKGRPPPLSLLAFTKGRVSSKFQRRNGKSQIGGRERERERERDGESPMIAKLKKHDQRLVAVTTASPGRATPATLSGGKEAKENIRTGPYDDDDDDEQAGTDTPARQTPM